MSFDSSISQGKGSKRKSLDSNSSNPFEKSHSRISHQKTLGMAWGANSHSSSKSCTRRPPFSNFGRYMEEKNRKLQNQFDADASTSHLRDSDGRTDLFRGISIFVDGFTIPSSQELRGYMLKHGGRFENYFSRYRVTHIVCSNLPGSKIRNLRSFSGGLPVVKPTWVLDSVAAYRVLDWFPYQLDQLVNETHNQRKLSAFFSLKSNSRTNDAEAHQMGDYFEHKIQLGEEPACPGDENSFEVGMAEASSSDLEDKLSVREAFEFSDSSSHKPSAAVSRYCSDDENSKELLASRIVGPLYQNHTSLGDSNFVENYFKNSRLHFIGTWRRRYRKRFPCFLKGVKQDHPNVTVPPVSRKTAIIHLDMDCFFVSVILRNHPDLQDKSVAVCHSDNPKGTAEISSANYPARDYGVRAGIFIRDAKALCPHLVIFPYDFKAYEEVADQFYSILHKYCNKVQAVSCDEAFLDVTELEDDNPEHIASIIRQEIFETTRCTASAGIAGNLLMARLATKTAKPNGQCYIPSEKVDDYLKNLPIKALPGIGHVLAEKLKNRNILTCGQLRMIFKESLQKDFGTKTGDMLWNYCRGVDSRPVEVVQEMKSIGAEVNWGVRLNNLKDSQDFLVNVCKEVSLRLQGCGMQGRTITMKVKKRKKGAGEPKKYLGCGDCENLSHTMTVPTATDDVNVLQRISRQLFGSFHIDFKEIRGIGLQVSRLENADNKKQGCEKDALRSWIASASEKTKHPSQIIHPTKETSDRGTKNKGKQLLSSFPVHQDNMPTVTEIKESMVGEVQSSSISCSGSLNMDISAMCAKRSDLIPASLSQVDVAVLQQLPEEFKADILELLPAHRTSECSASLDYIREPPHSIMRMNKSETSKDGLDLNSKTNLWMGSPPKWVGKFKVSNCLILNTFAEFYYKSLPCGLLSSILQYASSSLLSLDSSSEEWDEAHRNFCELLEQYVDLKIESDIEEIYICFRVLKRSEFLLQVFNNILPSLQAYVGENYGGKLQL